jgi:hypothetical protein
MELAAGAIGADLRFQAVQRIGLRDKHSHWFRRFRGFTEFRRWEFFGFSRFWFSTVQPCAPFRFAAEAVDTELAKEFEMVAELISGHD